MDYQNSSPTLYLPEKKKRSKNLSPTPTWIDWSKESPTSFDLVDDETNEQDRPLGVNGCRGTKLQQWALLNVIRLFILVPGNWPKFIHANPIYVFLPNPIYVAHTHVNINFYLSLLYN